MMKIDNSQVKILLVDDTPVNLEIAGKILERENYDLHIADSGQMAVELTESTDFDLILMDIMMPEMDGFESFTQIRRNKKCSTTPVIFLTAKVDIESVVKGFELGAVDYIRKPFNGLELLARVRTHVELKRTREELERKNRCLQEAYQRLETVATTDSLTGLFNRREVIRRLDYQRVSFERYQRHFSVIMGDIDFFKRINDDYGHNFGDHILSSVAGLLQANVRRNDIVGRWGGEEFLIILPETDAAGAATVAEKLRASIEGEKFNDAEHSARVTMTFGISTYTGPQSLDTLINKADSALYLGKDQGRNRVVCWKE